MRIDILGWYGQHNVGDEAYKLAFPSLLPGHDISFVSQRDLGDFTRPEPDAIILGGGDVVYPEFTREVLRHRPRTRRLVVSVTLTKGSDFEFLRGCEKVFVRDSRSLQLARVHGVDRACYLPDAAFALDPHPAAGRLTLRALYEREGRELYEKVVVVVVSSYLMHNGVDALARDYTAFQNVSLELARAFDQTNASFAFVPFCTKPPNDDRAANAWVASRCKYQRKNLVVHERLSVPVTLDVLSAADLVISSRYHATVFATLAGVPFADITHHDKNLGFLEMLDATDRSVGFWDFSPGRLRDLIDAGLARHGHGSGLDHFREGSREELRATHLL